MSQPTIYRWLQNYQSTELLSSLLNTKRDGGSEKSRLREDVKLILDDFLNTKFLSLQKFTPAAAAREIRRLCSNAGIDPLPSHTTVYRHIEWMSEEVKLRKREGPKAAREAFGVNEGSIPDADWPLAMVQIDHTLLSASIWQWLGIWQCCLRKACPLPLMIGDVEQSWPALPTHS